MVPEAMVNDEIHRRYHEVADIFPLMQGAEYEEFKADIAKHGLREPIWLHADGSIIDGRNRHRACIELGITPDFETWNGNGPLVAFVVSLNLHRRHLDEGQRGMIAAKIANMPLGGAVYRSANLPTDKVSQSEAADLLQVSERTIRNAKQVIDGGAPELIAAVENGKASVSAAAHVATLPVEWQQVIVANNDVAEAAKDMRQGRQDAVEDRVRPHVANNSGNNEWYTPAEYIEAARRVLGVIDLDPASSDEANTVVGADTYYTIQDDGLAQKWSGRVWLNPPYSSDLVGKFTDKLKRHFEAGDVEQAVVLVNNATETQWFQSLAFHATAICFPARRVRFWSPNGGAGAPLQGQALVYLGSNTNAFIDQFQDFGLLVKVA